MTDLVVRLRAISRREHDDLSIGDEAADEVLRLRELLDEAYADADDVLRPRVKYLESQVDKLQKIEKAARNLIAQKGRHNTVIAYQKLEEALK